MAGMAISNIYNAFDPAGMLHSTEYNTNQYHQIISDQDHNNMESFLQISLSANSPPSDEAELAATDQYIINDDQYNINESELCNDGSDTAKPAIEAAEDNKINSSCDNSKLLIEPKKAMPADKLAELAVIDPKRAKRIMANRLSAARSKERKTRYMADLERKVQSLQTEATTLSAQLRMLQRDTTNLTSENNELKDRLQSMEHQAQLCNALNNALREEINQLQLALGQLPGL